MKVTIDCDELYPYFQPYVTEFSSHEITDETWDSWLKFKDQFDAWQDFWSSKMPPVKEPLARGFEYSENVKRALLIDLASMKAN